MARQTSVDAYNKAKEKGLLTGKRLAIYEVLIQNGPLTTNEIFAKLVVSSKMNHPNVHARLAELRDMDAVRELGTKKCSVTGNLVILWDVTDNVPVKFSKKLSVGQRLEIAEAFIRENDLEQKYEELWSTP